MVTQIKVTILYVKGISEALRWMFHHQGVATVMKPHLTIKRMLLHTKDKKTPQENAGVMYKVTYRDCLYGYTGKTERRYGVKERNTNGM